MTRQILTLCLFFGFCTHLSAQSSADIQEYIRLYSQAALDQERAYGVPASITLAQGILESGAGKSGLTRNTNNHFGIKALGGWNGPVYYAWDDEPNKSKFRVYASAAESFRDHSEFLKRNSRYHSLFSKSVYDYRGWAIGLQKAGYATATNYAAALIGFIDAYKLYAVNGGVKLKAGKTVIVTHPVNTAGTKAGNSAAARPVFDSSCVQEESEASEEEENVDKAIRRYVVEINDVRCTILYPGMTLSSIAMKYDIPKQKLLEFNETTREEDIKEGDIVFLNKKKPKYLGAKDFHYVKPNENIYEISQEYGIKMANLMKMNDLTLFSHLKEGDKLRLK
ncbi:MAG: glucosaminidase domain-containing protein [Bacteroidaceae bacterium]|nr:glucosaminidase domain-containing protein [Bacteroidaceae bacterium]